MPVWVHSFFGRQPFIIFAFNYRNTGLTLTCRTRSQWQGWDLKVVIKDMRNSSLEQNGDISLGHRTGTRTITIFMSVILKIFLRNENKNIRERKEPFSRPRLR